MMEVESAALRCAAARTSSPVQPDLGGFATAARQQVLQAWPHVICSPIQQCHGRPCQPLLQALFCLLHYLGDLQGQQQLR